MSSQLFLNIAPEAALLLIIAISFAPIYYITKFIHIAHAVTITLGAYFTLILTSYFHFSLLAAIPLAIILATLVGVTCELSVYKPLRRLAVSPLSQLIASIGLYVILQNCISLFFGDDTKRIYREDITVGHRFLGGYITTIEIVIVITSVVLFCAFLLFTTKTNSGIAIRAVSDNTELSNIYGINSDKSILMTFALGSSMGALAGILYALDTTLTPTMGFNLLLYGLTALIIGGVGSYRGIIGGVLLISFARHLSAYYIDAKWMDTIAYTILILFLIWKPYGLSGNRLKKVEI